MIKISLFFLCNFKPFFVNKKFKNIKKKIFCKNFIIFLTFISLDNKLKANVFVKPLKKTKAFNILKAPHRFKKSQHSFVFSRYEIVHSFNLITDKNMFTDIKKTLFFLKTINLIFLNIDTSICTQNSRTFNITGYFLNEFTFSY